MQHVLDAGVPPEPDQLPDLRLRGGQEVPRHVRRRQDVEVERLDADVCIRIEHVLIESVQTEEWHILPWAYGAVGQEPFQQAVEVPGHRGRQPGVVADAEGVSINTGLAGPEHPDRGVYAVDAGRQRRHGDPRRVERFLVDDDDVQFV